MRAFFFSEKKQRCGIFFLREYLLKRMYNDISNVCICNFEAKIVNLCENTTSHCKIRLSTVSIDKKSTAAKCSGILVIQFSYIITYGTNQHLHAFFYKHHLYKHRQPEIWPKNKHHPSTSPSLTSMSM